MDNTLWQIERNSYDQNENKKYATLFTLANGYRGLKGDIEFSSTGHRGNYIAGVFDKSEAQVVEIVNCQDPLGFEIYIEGDLIDIDALKIEEFRSVLDMYEGVLHSLYVLQNKNGKIIKIESERFVSRYNVHRWATKYNITPLNFSGQIQIANSIDGRISNGLLENHTSIKHFNVALNYDLHCGIAQCIKTFDKGIEVIEASALIFIGESSHVNKSREYSSQVDKVFEKYNINLGLGECCTIYKYGSTYTSRDEAQELFNKCTSELKKFIKEGYEFEKGCHAEVLKKLWSIMDIKISGDEYAQKGIRFNLFQLSSSAYEKDERISIAAKALHGEGYKGHVFWDTEIFMLPFFIYTNPRTARALLMYRYNLLDGARRNAVSNGCCGAQFPWESADDGTETTPKWGIGYDGKPIRIWTGDEEIHISADIAFAIWEYYRATDDKKFMIDYGVEIIFETARFWLSRLEYNTKFNRYEIRNVIGPDEFHEHIDNNAYTNYLAKWNLKMAYKIALWIMHEDREAFDMLCRKLDISNENIYSWDRVQERIYIPCDNISGIIEQFEGYFKLKDIPITENDENGMPAWPDLKGFKLQDTQLIKQADVVMLMLILSDEFDRKIMKKNYEYYERRTMHKSSLSPSIYSIIGLNVGDTHNAYSYFIKTLMTDIEDNQGNTVHGFHAASAGGSWQCAVFGFGGFSIDEVQVPCFNPWIPAIWEELNFKVCWKNSIICVNILRDKVKIGCDHDITLKVYGKEYHIDREGIIEIARDNFFSR